MLTGSFPKEHGIWAAGYRFLLSVLQVQRPQSLLEASRVALRDQLTTVSDGRSILPSVELLPLPTPLRNYVALVDDLWR